MPVSRLFIKNLAVALVLVTAAATAALADQRGPVQASYDAGERAGTSPVASEFSASEDGRFQGSRVAPADRYGRYTYIVRFEEPSLARYEGGIEGLAPTSPRVTGQRLHIQSDAKAAYKSFLASRHEDYLAQIGQFTERSVRPTHQYLNALNGAAIRLTPDEAERVEGLPFVAGIELDRLDSPLTDEGPNLIGAPDFWAGATTSGVGNKGEGVIIGILDSGFNHDHPSFAEEAQDGFVHTNPYGDGVFVGVCADPSDPDFEDVCNNKLIGAYSIAADSTTAEDTAGSGHGSHVGSTAGGNPVTTQFSGVTVDITGVAPRANLINYKVCEPLCSGASRIAAIDFAIADGVDVINHSIGNGEPPWASAVSLAFLDANAAGIFVAASAGNSGPGPSTVASTGPWNASVAASTHGRIFAQDVDLDGLAPVAGVPSTGPELQNVFSGELRYAGDVDAANFEGCSAFTADAFLGEAALISRGSCAFADKINNAVDAGAEFVVVFNSAGGAPIAMGGAEATTVSSVMISDTAGSDFIAELAGGTATVTIDPTVSRFVDQGFADVMAGFSSRGPASHNTIAPAITAPGVSILAASTDANGNFNILGGTSMSSPHIAGSAALLVAQHPDWTPTEIRSALTLTATPDTLKEDGITPSDAFDHGSGRVQVPQAGQIGFVMDESIANFVAADPSEGGDPGDLNLSSIKNAACIETCSYQRTIRSVMGDPINYTVSTDVPPGVVITVTPSEFTLSSGAEQTLDIEIDVTGAPFDEWLFADIRLEGSAAGSASYSDTNAGGPTFARPFTPGDGTSGSCDLSGTGSDVAYHVQDIEVATSGDYTIESAQDYDGYLHVYEDGFDPLDACLNLIALNDDAGGGSLIDNVALSDAATYTVVTSGFSNTDVGNFTNTITGPGAITLIGALRGGPAVQVSDTHIPVAVTSLPPKPVISVSVDGLSATQQRDEVTQQSFAIFNEGQEPLEWALNELGPQGGGLPPQVSGVIWDNPQAGSSGRINNFSIGDGTGIYQSDAFAILAPSSVETIFSAGFTLGSPGVTDLEWMVFEDAGGVPAGDPENNPGDAVWSFSAAADATGVSFVDGEMLLDLAAAGAPPLNLDPGVYWLLAYPTVQTYSLGPNNLYAWFHGESANTGRQIGPGGLSGFPTSWVGAPEGRAFTLSGTIDCSSQFNPWTNVTPTSGLVNPGESDDVTVEFFSTGLQEGTYNSGFCVLSNDDDQPATLLPVQLNVVNLPAASTSSVAESFSVEFGNTDNGQIVIGNSGLGELEFNVRGAGNGLRGTSGLIYDQTASETTNGALAIYDLDGPATWAVQAADDFTVPADESWVIDQVVANGFYQSLVNPTSDVRVFFYEDDNGQPGAEFTSFDDLVPSSDDNGVLTVDLPQTVGLGGGTYWVSVQPEMDYVSDGQWFWFSNADQIGSEFHWRNPGDGYGSGCTDWDTSTSCGFANPDLSFQLFGVAEDACDAIDAVSWLSVDPESGIVAAEGGEQPVDLLVDGSAVLPGSYEATICFDTNDGANPVLSVDVSLEITGEASDGIFLDRFEGAAN